MSKPTTSLIRKADIAGIGQCTLLRQAPTPTRGWALVLHLPTGHAEMPYVSITTCLTDKDGQTARDEASFDALCAAINDAWIAIMAGAARTSVTQAVAGLDEETRALLRAKATVDAMLADVFSS